MADFSMSLSGLSSKALEFIKDKNIDENSDGQLSTSERDKLGAYLSGSEQFPDEYINIQDELTEFARNFDEQAAKSNLSKDEITSVRANMSDKDKKKIDTIRDYSTMKAVADGKISGYTPAQRAYAKALLENSAYARELMLKEQNQVLQTQNRELLEENNQLHKQIENSRRSAKEDIGKARNAKAELNELLDLSPDISKSLENTINDIEKSSGNIIDACDKIDDFSKKNISEKTLKDAINAATAKIDAAKTDIQISKQKGRDILTNIEKQKQEEQSTNKSTDEAEVAEVAEKNNSKNYKPTMLAENAANKILKDGTALKALFNY